MRRIFFLASFLLLALLLVATVEPMQANAAVISVGNRSAYSTIAQAIDAASPGDTIVIGPGTYAENLVVNKPLTIIGNGSAKTIIQAIDPNKDVLQLRSKNVRVEGLTVRGASGASGVNVAQVSSCVVTGISAHGNIRGVYLNQATNNEIKDSNLADNGYGVYCDYASSNTISNNVATGEKGNGNTLGDGVYLFYSDSNTITKNDLSGNHVYGISLYHSSNNTISTNIISTNEQIGVRLRESDNNELDFNTIRSNAQQGVLIIQTHGNQIYLNSFVNQPNALSNSPETSLSSPQKMSFTYNGSAHTGYMGNYYSDYKCDDKNNDGICDVGTSFGDSYPLVHPVDNYSSISIATATSSASATANVSTNSLTSSTAQANNALNTPGFEVGAATVAIVILVLCLKRSQKKLP